MKKNQSQKNNTIANQIQQTQSSIIFRLFLKTNEQSRKDFNTHIYSIEFSNDILDRINSDSRVRRKKNVMISNENDEKIAIQKDISIKSKINCFIDFQSCIDQNVKEFSIEQAIKTEFSSDQICSFKSAFSIQAISEDQ